MKTKVLSAVLFVICGLGAEAQITFQKTYGGSQWDECFSVQQTNDSGFIMAGFTNSFGSGSEDLYLAKTDKKGSLQWTKTYGGTGQEMRGSVQQTSDGGYILGGNTNSFGSGAEDFCLIKTDGFGSVQWMKTYGGAGTDKFHCVRQTKDKGFIMTGWTTSVGAVDLYLVRTDSDGVVSWSKTFKNSAAGASTYGYFVLESNDNGFFVVGETAYNSQITSGKEFIGLKLTA